MGLSSLTAGFAGCANDDAVASSEQNVQTKAQALTTVPHLPGISDADFLLAQTNFAAVETAADGIGPVFNEFACGNCHTLGGLGGAGVQIERRYGRFDLGLFNTLSSKGGTLRQLMTLGAWKTGCNVPLEVEPTNATVHNVGRMTTPLFGLGLVDAMPDSFFTTLRNNEPFGQQGDIVTAKIALPDPKDPSQSVNSNRVGRFGWKGQVPNLVQFAADAYVNEMGITTTHCSKGTLVTAFASESKPNGVAVSTTCEDGIPGVDDNATPTGTCAPNQNAIQADVANFTTFMTFLPPPPVNTPSGTLTSPDSMPGATVFNLAGCVNCHTRTTFVTPNVTTNGVPGNFSFRPYSDFLVHDMGSLGDQIGNDFDTQTTTRKMRTAPLWGLRFRETRLLHDARAASISAAIIAHDGQGLDSSNRFQLLPQANKNDLIAYLRAL